MLVYRNSYYNTKIELEHDFQYKSVRYLYRASTCVGRLLFPKNFGQVPLVAKHILGQILNGTWPTIFSRRKLGEGLLWC